MKQYLDPEVLEKFNGKEPLFKVMALENAHKSFCGNKPYLWFSNPGKWKDPFERRFYNATYVSVVDGTHHDFPLKDRVWGCSFNFTRTIEPQWTIYSGNKCSLRFNFQKQNLLKSIEDFADSNGLDVYIGHIRYFEQKKLAGKLTDSFFTSILGEPFSLQNHNLLVKLMFLKRNAFCYENEVRILLVAKEGTKIDSNWVDGIKVPIKFQDIIDVTITPLGIEEIKEPHEDITTVFKAKNVKMIKSQLYNEKWGNHIFEI